MLSGFCMFQLSPSNFMGISVVQAVTINNASGIASNNHNPCAGEQSAENGSKPAPADHNQNSLMFCCATSHNGIISTIQSIKSGLSIPIVFFPQYQLEISSPRIAYIYSPNIPPPALALIKTIVLRL